ncbi:MAG TPA: plasmid pRiA4b ORF-3 family protein [Acidimicrobiales bacterium]|nr:plasmid pRiA4b ORF-3 family protein [Acidimicrobiales bacterium]
MASTVGSTLTVHNLRVTLLDVTPPVWRLVRVPSAVPLSVVHAILQVAMGWEDRHLHEWRVGDDYYGPDPEDDDVEDDSSVTLAEVAPADSVLHYEYDLGDGWEHLVEVLSVDPYDGTVPPVAVLDGARAAPPEDCGGPTGYADLLAALDNPSDLDHADFVAAYGDRLDPEAFDRGLINRRLEAFWRPAG